MVAHCFHRRHLQSESVTLWREYPNATQHRHIGKYVWRLGYAEHTRTGRFEGYKEFLKGVGMAGPHSCLTQPAYHCLAKYSPRFMLPYWMRCTIPSSALA